MAEWRPIDLADSNALMVRLTDAYASLDLAGRLAAVRQEVRGPVVFTTSFGIEDQAIVHAIFDQNLDVDVVTIDTGRLFPETHDLWAETERRYGRRIRGLFPEQDCVEALLARQGANGFRASIEARHACCGVRKVGPLERALAGSSAWVSGLRAEQSAGRSRMRYAAFDPRHRIIKVNPLFDWTRERVVAFVRDHAVPFNPLHDRGFLSIGCAPCTRAVTPGEPERAGRWWWEQEEKKECGLHTGHPARDRRTESVSSET